MQEETQIVMEAQSGPERTFKTALLWWNKGQDILATQKRIANLIQKPMESRVFTELPTPTFSKLLVDRVCWIELKEKSDSTKDWSSLKPHFLFHPQWTSYSVEGAYEQAKAEADPQFSPHGAFRNLSATEADRWTAAIDFINEFGPLELFDEAQPKRKRLELTDLLEFGPEDNDINERPVWVDLGDFWEKHRRFVSVAKLWEARESRMAMVAALSELAWLPVYPPIGAWRKGEKYSPVSAFPWEHGKFEEWRLRRLNEKQVRDASAEIVKAELNLWAHEMKIQWTCSDTARLDFRIVPSADSLWSAIWHLFARDTSEGLGWRICPHCSKLFYPKRKDSYFCESKYQKLFAANRWWHEHQEDELAKRQEARKSSAKRKPAKAVARKGK